ncbi:MAG: YidC/Oxa1 family membrane protein insertase [Acetatifactor muris]|nr:YidC/Oxa1 family membrane protein insertase [Acetatifactor muris]MCM1525631.1 YidC/Oxa1 family membrane protein insertase [Bacteroides sp.]
MNGILLTQNSTPIFKYIVWILGKIMEGIFTVIDWIGIPNIGLAIILFTIVINLLMMPLTIKQQKFSKLSAKMSPELQAIQNKYKNRKDQNSQMAMNNEMQALYAKYGVSPTGGCGYLLIQMPILLALYRVIYAMPAYVKKIGDTFRILAAKVIATDGAEWLMNPTFADPEPTNSIANTVSMYGKSLLNGNLENGIVDVLNRLSSSDMALVAEHYNLSDLTFNGRLILSNGATRGLIDTYNNFLGLNIGDSPQSLIVENFHNGAWLLLIGALAIPVLSAVTQWINVKLMPQQENPKDMDDQTAQMQSTMKTMNMFMPLLSAWFCFTLPAGMGIYWVAGSVVRGIQQVLINKHIDKIDFNEIIEKNADKSAQKMKKLKENQDKLNAYANMNAKKINKYANSATDMNKDTDSEPKPSKAGSMMAKANMVSDYNKKHRT